mgnify:CR=1 FL=1
MADRNIPALMGVAFLVLALLIGGYMWRSASHADDKARGSAHGPLNSINADAPNELISPDAGSTRAQDTPSTSQVATVTSTSPRLTNGRFAFADGSIPPEINFEVYALELAGAEDREALIARAEEANRAGQCRNWMLERSLPDGTFTLSNLCPGVYGVRLRSHTGLGLASGAFRVPDDSPQFVLTGYLVQVIVEDSQNRPLGKALVSARYTKDIGVDLVSGDGMLTAFSDESGLAYFALPSPGGCEVNATKDLEKAGPQVVTLAGPSRVEHVRLTLKPSYWGASLRVHLQSCDSFPVSLSDFCIVLSDTPSGDPIVRLCSSSDKRIDVFRGLNPGRFFARAMPTYSSSPEFYLELPEGRVWKVELRDNEEAVLTECVELGGRVSILLRDEGAIIDSAPVNFTVCITADGSNECVPLQFRRPTATGVTVLYVIQAGETLVSENVLAPGVYELLVSGPGYGPVRAQCTIVAGSSSTIEIGVRRQSGD